jgi:magnesium transporter
MIRSLYIPSGGQLLTDIDQSTYQAALRDKGGVLWVDFQGNPPEQDLVILEQVFKFHPLAIDDALQESHVPKLDDWSAYLYIVLHAITYDRERDNQVETLELDVFLGKNFLVTHHDLPLPAIERTWEACQRDERYAQRGTGYLFYKLADEVVASFMPVVEGMDEEIDYAEDSVFDRPSPDTLERIFRLKRAALQIRRVLGPQREVLNKLARDDYEAVDPRVRIYFRDVYDHLVRMHEIIESVRDLVGGTLDTYLSVINNRMNEIMKTLTVITTLFMPISFIASFFGMNFLEPVVPLPEWTGTAAFYITLAIMVLLPASMFLWVRRRGWM